MLFCIYIVFSSNDLNELCKLAYNNVAISLSGRWMKKWGGRNHKYRKWLFLFNYISMENSIAFLFVWNSLRWLRNITSACLIAVIPPIQEIPITAVGKVEGYNVLKSHSQGCRMLKHKSIVGTLMLGKEDPEITRGWQQKLQEGNLAQTLGWGRI